MRILYIDIDSLRPDHLGCYGYHRNTSPNIDSLAKQGVRFTNIYATDAPCAPSRTALWSGRFGFRNGLVGHGGTGGDIFIEGAERGFRSSLGRTNWMTALREAGLHTVTISSFGERHSVWHWYAGFNEIINPGFGGMDDAHQVLPHALDWLDRNGQSDNWFLHVNFWDPHTPYSTPTSFGDPFEDEPIADWITEEVRQAGWEGYGPHSPQEVQGYGGEEAHQHYPRVPEKLDSMESVKQWIDGYDTGIRYADDAVGQLVNGLKQAEVFDDTIIIVSADHGENQGELNIWGDHQTADQITCNVPLIVRWPDHTEDGRVDEALHYHFDWAATLIELAGGQVPDNWDGRPFTQAFKENTEEGRGYLTTSQGAWAVQRGVRFGDYICLRTYHDGFKMLDPIMLFNLKEDYHEQNNLAEENPEIVNQAMAYLADWQAEMILTSPTAIDPLMTVLREGGPFHTKGRLPAYLARLRATGRAHHADHLQALHPDEA